MVHVYKRRHERRFEDDTIRIPYERVPSHAHHQSPEQNLYLDIFSQTQDGHYAKVFLQSRT